MQNMLHFLQGVIAPSDAKYTMMDYGRDENMARYGQAEAPIYDLRTFSIPTAIFSGSNDWMADPIDVQKLYDSIDPQYIVHSDVQADYAHLDFVWATNAAERIYTQVQALLLEGGEMRKLTQFGPCVWCLARKREIELENVCHLPFLYCYM